MSLPLSGLACIVDVGVDYLVLDPSLGLQQSVELSCVIVAECVQRDAEGGRIANLCASK